MLNGPINKSLFTQELELIAKCLLHASESAVAYTHHEKAEIHVKFDDIDIDMSSLYKKVNFNHLYLDEKDSDSYINNIDAHVSYGYDDGVYRNEGIGVQTIAPLSQAEIKAIRNFTGSGYVSVNNMLYGKTDWIWSENEAVIESVLIASGLNKISPSEAVDTYTYRSESSVPLEQVNHRIDLVNHGGGITHEPAFMSTSADYKVSLNFSPFNKDKSIIIFEEAYGKDISQISYFPDEQEFLLMPSTIIWDGYEYKDGIHFFHAKVGAPLETEVKPTSEDYALFSKLLNWANDHDIATDFLTPFVKSQLESENMPESLDNTINDNIISTEIPIIQHEESNWLSCIEEIVKYNNEKRLEWEQFKKAFENDVIRFNDVIDMNEKGIIKEKMEAPKLTDIPIEVTPILVTPMETVSTENLLV
ncbi:MAG: hypothetical protein JSS07_08955 [Proteobacteria bacterium]|nr:hypothetical protein [Pseudomonadota bacterium]